MNIFLMLSKRELSSSKIESIAALRHEFWTVVMTHLVRFLLSIATVPTVSRSIPVPVPRLDIRSRNSATRATIKLWAATLSREQRGYSGLVYSFRHICQIQREEPEAAQCQYHKHGGRCHTGLCLYTHVFKHIHMHVRICTHVHT